MFKTAKLFFTLRKNSEVYRLRVSEEEFVKTVKLSGPLRKIFKCHKITLSPEKKNLKAIRHVIL